MNLYSNRAPVGDEKDPFVPTLDLYPVETTAPKGAVLICPGGGYGGRALHEGKDIAEAFNREGIHAFVVQYRVAPNRHPAPLADVSRAMWLFLPCSSAPLLLCLWFLFVFFFSVCPIHAEDYVGASFVDFAGYTGCVKLENGATEVVLGHHAGGRVLSYALNGVEAIFLDPAHYGWVDGPDKKRADLSGGRFDIGPEHTIPKHPNLWRGPWSVEITGDRKARMTSVEDDATGVQLIRDFELNAETSHLSCTQTIRNVSEEVKHWGHWSRTFAQGHGICLIPLTPNSRFPKNYVMYGPGSVIDFRPNDKNIRERDGFLEIFGPPERPKLGMDSHAGWFAYVMRNDLMFVKGFATYPDRAYGEMAALTISIWYKDNVVCELEPIGPKENIGPGEGVSFTEDWWLAKVAFPGEGEMVELGVIKKIVQECEVR